MIGVLWVGPPPGFLSLNSPPCAHLCFVFPSEQADRATFRLTPATAPAERQEAAGPWRKRRRRGGGSQLPRTAMPECAGAVCGVQAAIWYSKRVLGASAVAH